MTVQTPDFETQQLAIHQPEDAGAIKDNRSPVIGRVCEVDSSIHAHPTHIPPQHLRSNLCERDVPISESLFKTVWTERGMKVTNRRHCLEL